MKKILYLLLCLAFAASISAQSLTMPRVFSDHMVLQRDMAIPLWGQASPGLAVAVEIDNTVYATAEADARGKWKTYLPPMNAGGPYTIRIRADKDMIFKDVYIGEVWLASGQSNMQWPVEKAANAQNEISGANWPLIRIFQVPKQLSSTPQTDVSSGTWEVVSPETIGGKSAVAYFFAREIHQKLNVPVGIVEASWGGTPAEAWTSFEALRFMDDYRAKTDSIRASGADYNAEHLKSQQDRKAIDQQIADVSVALSLGITNAGYDDSGWKTTRFPQDINTIVPKSFSGIVWLRQSFTLKTVAKSASPYVLSLGGVNDKCRVWVNGKELETDPSSKPKERRFSVPAKLLKKGENAISLRLIANQGSLGNVNRLTLLTFKDEALLYLNGDWKTNSTLEAGFPLVESVSNKPAALFNQMINPLIPYAIRGAIWYQGESNASRAYQYRQLFPLMINDWRIRWGQGYFPFLYVQLANFLDKDTIPRMDSWAELREAQLFSLNLPATGMATAIDLGEMYNIHPKNKQEVGRRLSLIARAMVYGEVLQYSGPLYESAQFIDNEAIISFSETGSGLMAANGTLKGFAVAGSDQVFHWAQARIEGEKVIVWSEKVPHPVAVRYGWSNNPDATLYNREGLPASPFRTDTWPGVTQGVK